MKYGMEEIYHSVTKNLCSTIVVASLVLAVTFISLTSRRKKEESSRISGSLGLPLIGETFLFLSASNTEKGCYEFVRLRRLRYGKWFKTRIYGKIHVFVPSREGAKEVLNNEFVDFNKGYVKSMADCVGHKSVLCVSQQDDHTRIRRLISPPFSLSSLSKFLLYFDRILVRNLRSMQQSSQPFKVLDLGTKMISDAMCNMLMSVTEDSLLQMIQKDCTTVSDAMVSFPLMIPGTRYYNGIKARKRMIETLKKLMEGRRRDKGHDDFLNRMLQRDSNTKDEKLDDSEIMDNILTLLIAGQTTTGPAMMWAVKFLADNVQAQDILREEQLSIARSKQQGYSLTLEDLNKMSYGLKVVKETLRMSNVLLWFPRVALRDCTIDGYEIKKGWNVNIDATFIHSDPDIYSNPMQFDPSRFDEMPKPYSFMPFGSGPRTCLGMNMAKVTMLVFLHRLTSVYRWRVHDLDPSLEKKSHIPILKSGCPITLEALRFG